MLQTLKLNNKNGRIAVHYVIDALNRKETHPDLFD